MDLKLKELLEGRIKSIKDAFPGIEEHQYPGNRYEAGRLDEAKSILAWMFREEGDGGVPVTVTRAGDDPGKDIVSFLGDLAKPERVLDEMGLGIPSKKQESI